MTDKIKYYRTKKIEPFNKCAKTHQRTLVEDQEYGWFALREDVEKLLATIEQLKSAENVNA